MDLVINISYGRPGFLVSLINTSYGECNHTASSFDARQALTGCRGAVCCHLPPRPRRESPLMLPVIMSLHKRSFLSIIEQNNSEIDLGKSGESKAREKMPLFQNETAGMKC